MSPIFMIAAYSKEMQELRKELSLSKDYLNHNLDEIPEEAKNAKI